MKKVVKNDSIIFYDEDKELFELSFKADEFCIRVLTGDEILIPDDNELFNCLEIIMNNKYDFGDNLLGDVVEPNHFVWHSDCYYDPDNESSVNAISVLTIDSSIDTLTNKNILKLKCSRVLDQEFPFLKKKGYLICFSAMGNGRYAKRIDEECTLQDDIVNMYYTLKNEYSLTKKGV